MTMKPTTLVVLPTSGEIFRTFKDGSVRPAGWLDGKDYRYLSVCGKNRPFHQVIWEQVNGPVPEGFEIDHKDGDGLNNKIDNLRLVTHSQNMQNQHRPRSNNVTSGVKGVHWDKGRGKWRVHIAVNKRQIFIGRFDCLDAASTAYRAAALAHHTHNPFGAGGDK